MSIPGRETLENVRAWVLLILGVVIVIVALLTAEPTVLFAGVALLGGAPVVAAKPSKADE